jgi:putative NIF3 family GTP cyclohydrolase 1 type 2
VPSLELLVAELDDELGTARVEGDVFGRIQDELYPGRYWREFMEPSYEGRWNGLLVRGSERVERAATCVFPSDRIVASLPPATLLFSEHPVDLVDELGFVPLARRSFERMVADGISFYHSHAPLDHHPRIGPSPLVADVLELRERESFYPIAEGLEGGSLVVGDSPLGLDELAARLDEALGPEVPVRIVRRRRDEEGRVVVAAGGGAVAAMLEAALERGCGTYVTGNAITECRLDFVQADVRAFNELAARADVSVVDTTHYGSEKLPQLAMVEWFREHGVDAEFVQDGPK